MGSYVDKATSEFVITNKSVVVKIGLIWRRPLEMNLSRAETVHVDQSMLSRLLDYRTSTSIGTVGTRESFRRISKPF